MSPPNNTKWSNLSSPVKPLPAYDSLKENILFHKEIEVIYESPPKPNETTPIKMHHSVDRYQAHLQPLTNDILNSYERGLTPMAENIVCFVCESHVEEEELEKHLLFGPAQCGQCGCSLQSCSSFRDTSTLCNHTIHLTQDSVSFLFNKFSRNSHFPDRGFVGPHDVIKLIDYLDSFEMFVKSHRLKKTIGMYKRMIQTSSFGSNRNFVYFKESKEMMGEEGKDLNLDINDSSREDGNEHILAQNYDLGSLEQAVEYVGVVNSTIKSPVEVTTSNRCPFISRKFRRRRQKSGTILKQPSDGYYLILTRAIEECPMCYTSICPTGCRVNVRTRLVTYVCTECMLTIYFVVSSQVTIVNEKSTDIHE